MRLRGNEVGHEFPVADFQHVRIVPPARPGDVSGFAVLIYPPDHAGKSVVDVPGRPP